MLRHFVIDEGAELSVREQLEVALRANAVRVIDLFREWDADGDGGVSKDEFATWMGRLGFSASRGHVDELFDTWDANASGEDSRARSACILKQRTCEVLSAPAAMRQVSLRTTSSGGSSCGQAAAPSRGRSLPRGPPRPAPLDLYTIVRSVSPASMPRLRRCAPIAFRCIHGAC